MTTTSIKTRLREAGTAWSMLTILAAVAVMATSAYGLTGLGVSIGIVFAGAVKVYGFRGLRSALWMSASSLIAVGFHQALGGLGFAYAAGVIALLALYRAWVHVQWDRQLNRYHRDGSLGD